MVGLRLLTGGKHTCQIPTLPITIASHLHLGRACTPHWVIQGFVALGQVSGGNGGKGGLTYPRLQHWVKWRVWDFSALGGLTNSVTRRVVKLTVSHYYSAPLPLQKRGYGDIIQKPVVFMIPSTGSGLGIGGHGMHNQGRHSSRIFDTCKWK